MIGHSSTDFQTIFFYCRRKIRYNGYNGHIWDRPEPYPRSPPPLGAAFHPLHPAPAVSPLQPALMVDVSQVNNFLLQPNLKAHVGSNVLYERKKIVSVN